MAERRRHLKAEVGLSATAREIIQRAFDEGTKTYDDIAAEVLLGTGEQIGKSSVARAWKEWNLRRLNREARETALRQFAELQKLPADKLDEAIKHILRTIAFDELTQGKPGEFDPGKLLRAFAALERIDLDKKRTAMLEQRLAVLQQRAADAAQAVDRVAGKRQLSPEDLAEIREKLYGITRAA